MPVKQVDIRQAGPSKMKCCPNADARKITREEHEGARQVARNIAKPNRTERAYLGQ